jgi:hypothetical protein
MKSGATSRKVSACNRGPAWCILAGMTSRKKKARVREYEAGRTARQVKLHAETEELKRAARAALPEGVTLSDAINLALKDIAAGRFKYHARRAPKEVQP